MKRVLVVQPWGIGDVLMVTPLVRSIIERSPGIKLGFICGGQGAKEYLQLAFPGSDIHVFSQRRRSIGFVFSFFFQLRQFKYAEAYLATGISSLYGFFLKVLGNIPVIKKEKVSHEEEQASAHNPHHRCQRNLSLIGIQHATPEEWPMVGPNLTKLPEIPSFFSGRGNSNSPIIAIHPGSSQAQGATKRPNAEVLTDLENRLLVSNSKIQILRLIGPEDYELKGRNPSSQSFTDVNITSIGQLCSILKECDGLISGDSGYGHIGAAMGLPVVTLAGPTQVEATRPWTTKGIVISTREQLDCMPCYGTSAFYHCPRHNQCMSSIRAEDIITALKQLVSTIR